MANPLRLPPALLDATLALAELAARLPASLERLEEDIAGMRRAVEPLDSRMREMQKGLDRVAELQGATNEGISALVRGVDPLEEGIDRTSANILKVAARVEELQKHMDGLRDELVGMRADLEPVGNTAERFEQFRRRLPGGPD